MHVQTNNTHSKNTIYKNVIHVNILLFVCFDTCTSVKQDSKRSFIHGCFPVLGFISFLSKTKLLQHLVILQHCDIDKLKHSIII